MSIFLWNFLPDGPLRSSLFVIATVTWVMSLLINLNPLLRFDGYYLLAVLLGVDNLQQRGFALGRWCLREALFGLGHAPPERFKPPIARRLLVYAYATWVWRFFLFITIAVVIYHVFFKAVAIVLMAIGLGWFIGSPVAREIGVWWSLRGDMRLNRNSIVTLLLLGGVVWLLVTPWQSRIGLPALLQADAETAVYPPVPGRIAEVQAEAGQRVEAGDLLFRMDSPDLAYEIAEREAELAIVQQMIRRRAAGGEVLDRITVLEQELAQRVSRLWGLRAREDRLTIRAAISGRLGDVPLASRKGAGCGRSYS